MPTPTSRNLLWVSCLPLSVAFLLAFALVLLPAGATLHAQDPAEPEAVAPVDDGFDRMPVNEEVGLATKKDIGKWLRAGQVPPADEARFEEYYRNYVLARWTAVEYAAEVSKYRSDLRRDFASAKVRGLHDRLVTLAFEVLRSLVQGNYPPVARFNAMLAIGDLNTTEPTFKADAVPWPGTLEFMVQEFKDPDQIDVVRVAALLGIGRQVSVSDASSLTQEQIDFRNNELIPMLVGVVTTKVEPGRSIEGHNWLRMLSIKALGRLGQPGTADDPTAIAKLLTTVATDDMEDMFLRRPAVATLGYLVDLPGAGVDVSKLVATLGEFAVDLCTVELERRDLEDAESASSRPGYGVYAFSLSPEASLEKAAESRRRLKHDLEPIRIALAGNAADTGLVKAVGGTPNQEYVEAIEKQLKVILSLLDKIDTQDLQLRKQIETQRDVLSERIGAQPAPVAAVPAAVTQ